MVQRTMMAQQAFDFSTLFALNFARKSVAGTCARRPHLIAPPETTGGGKQTVQHIVLEADPRGAGATVTVGWVDVTKKRASLRTLGCIEGMARARRRANELDPATYQTFFNEAQQFLTAHGFAVQYEAEPPPASVPPPANGSSGTRIAAWLMISLIAFVLLGVVAVALYFWSRGFRW